MSFTLTRAHLDSVLAPAYAGNLPAFLAHVEPEVEWRMGASEKPGKGGSGVYNVATFNEHIMPIFMAAFEPGALKHEPTATDIIGNKAIVEEVANGAMKNGHAFHNKQCLVFEFSAETGKINKIRGYADTELKHAAIRSLGFDI